jgi:hypothetical protein
MSGPASHEFGFAYMVFGVAPPSADLRVAFIPVSEKQILELARMMSKKLSEPLPPMPIEVENKMAPHVVAVAPTVFPQIDIPGYPPLHGAIDRFGQTAMTAQWIHRMTVEVATGRRGGVLQAVSLYLTGLDRDADNGAISACRNLRLGPKAQPLPMTPESWEKVRSDARPLAVQIFLQPLARLDPSIRCAFLALGAAFFGTLGVEGERHGEPEAPGSI